MLLQLAGGKPFVHSDIMWAVSAPRSPAPCPPAALLPAELRMDPADRDWYTRADSADHYGDNGAAWDVQEASTNLPPLAPADASVSTAMPPTAQALPPAVAPPTDGSAPTPPPESEAAALPAPASQPAAAILATGAVAAQAAEATVVQEEELLAEVEATAVNLRLMDLAERLLFLRTVFLFCFAALVLVFAWSVFLPKISVLG